MRIVKLNAETKKNILNDLLKRSPNNYGSYADTVEKIVNNVRDNGDKALFDYTKQFDKADIHAGNVQVTKEEIEYAYTQVDEKLLEVIRKAKENIRVYHEKQRQYSWFDTDEKGIMLGQKVTALESVGVYVPGGKAVYPSSVLMNIMPAKVAGVSNIIMTTPCNKDGEVYATTLVAANEAGATAIYKAGGAQAIAGPSEILVIADETANPRYVAADLLSQAEHDEMASAILITTSKELAEQVSAQVDAFIKDLSRKDIIQKSIDTYGYILLADNLADAVDAANAIASEHLEIVTANPFDVMTKIKNAGAIFIGEYSSEPLGDYFAGPNHVLPTNGTAKFFSPLSVDDFIKKSSIIYYSKDALAEVHEDIESFAKAEQLTAHANSIAVRFE